MSRTYSDDMDLSSKQNEAARTCETAQLFFNTGQSCQTLLRLNKTVSVVSLNELGYKKLQGHKFFHKFFGTWRILIHG